MAISRDDSGCRPQAQVAAAAGDQIDRAGSASVLNAPALLYAQVENAIEKGEDIHLLFNEL